MNYLGYLFSAVFCIAMFYLPYKHFEDTVWLIVLFFFEGCVLLVFARDLERTKKTETGEPLLKRVLPTFLEMLATGLVVASSTNLVCQYFLAPLIDETIEASSRVGRNDDLSKACLNALKSSIKRAGARDADRNCQRLHAWWMENMLHASKRDIRFRELWEENLLRLLQIDEKATAKDDTLAEMFAQAGISTDRTNLARVVNSTFRASFLGVLRQNHRVKVAWDDLVSRAELELARDATGALKDLQASVGRLARNDYEEDFVDDVMRFEVLPPDLLAWSKANSKTERVPLPSGMSLEEIAAVGSLVRREYLMNYVLPQKKHGYSEDLEATTKILNESYHMLADSEFACAVDIAILLESHEYCTTACQDSTSWNGRVVRGILSKQSLLPRWIAGALLVELADPYKVNLFSSEDKEYLLRTYGGQLISSALDEGQVLLRGAQPTDVDIRLAISSATRGSDPYVPLESIPGYKDISATDFQFEVAARQETISFRATELPCFSLAEFDANSASLIDHIRALEMLDSELAADTSRSAAAARGTDWYRTMGEKMLGTADFYGSGFQDGDAKFQWAACFLAAECFLRAGDARGAWDASRRALSLREDGCPPDVEVAQQARAILIAGQQGVDISPGLIIEAMRMRNTSSLFSPAYSALEEACFQHNARMLARSGEVQDGFSEEQRIFLTNEVEKKAGSLLRDRVEHCLELYHNREFEEFLNWASILQTFERKIEFDFECQAELAAVIELVEQILSGLGGSKAEFARVQMRAPSLNGWRVQDHFADRPHFWAGDASDLTGVSWEFENALNNWYGDASYVKKFADPSTAINASLQSRRALDNTELARRRLWAYTTVFTGQHLFPIAICGPLDRDKFDLGLNFVHSVRSRGSLDVADRFCDSLEALLKADGRSVVTTSGALGEINAHRGDIKYARGDRKGAAVHWREYGLLGESGSLFALLRAADALGELGHSLEAEEVLQDAEALGGAFALGPIAEIRLKYAIEERQRHGEDRPLTRQRVAELYGEVGLECLANADAVGSVLPELSSAKAKVR